jgi:hypothetical protein
MSAAVLRLLVLLVASIRRVRAAYILKHVLRLTQSNHEQTRRKCRDFECGALGGKGGEGEGSRSAGLASKTSHSRPLWGGGHGVGGSQRTLSTHPKRGMGLTWLTTATPRVGETALDLMGFRS